MTFWVFKYQFAVIVFVWMIYVDVVWTNAKHMLYTLHNKISSFSVTIPHLHSVDQLFWTEHNTTLHHFKQQQSSQPNINTLQNVHFTHTKSSYIHHTTRYTIPHHTIKYKERKSFNLFPPFRTHFDLLAVNFDHPFVV